MGKSQGLILVLLISLVNAEPYLRHLQGTNDTNDTNDTNLTTTTDANLTATAAPTTTALTTTSPTTMPTTSTAAAARTNNFPLVAVLIVIGVLVLLGLGGLAIYGLLVYLQNSAKANIQLVKQVDSEAADFEANLTSLQSHVQRVSHRLEQDQAKKEAVSKEYVAFQTKWKSIEVQSKEFLEQYTTCLRERQEWQRGKDFLRRQKQQKRQAEAKRKADEQLQREIRKKRAELEKEDKKRLQEKKEGETPAPAKTPQELDTMARELVRAGQEDSGRAVLVIGGSRQNLVPEEEVGLCPEAAVTSNSELRLQLKSMETLRNSHNTLVTELKELRDQAGITGLEDLELRVSSEVKVQGWSSGGRYLEEQVKIINSFSHPLLQAFKVKPHGVLGNAEGQKELAPLAPVEAVVVDPAGFPFIGYRNSCRGAGGASGSIYKWLNLTAAPANGRFPPEVNRHFAASREVEAEGRAKLHVYNVNQVVIHTVGPKLRDLLPGVQSLSRTYLNVLSEYCQAILSEEKAPISDKGNGKGKGKGKPAVKIPRILRLCPISSGIFCEDARLQPHMAEITWAALALGLAMLPLELQELLKTVELEVCVFQSREVTVYQSALDSKVAPGPLKLAQRGQIASRGPPTGPGGFDWVRKQNGTQDRLERLAAFMNTAQALASGGYVLGSEPSQALTLAPMLDGTRIHRAAEAPEDAPGAAEASSAVPKVVYDQDGLTVLDAAVKVSKEGRKAVAVNAASAYSVGGGVMSGGRHALEESCCITSTLLASLQKAQWDQLQTPEEKKPDERGHWHEAEAFHAHVPVDGCILSPFVEVFREGSNDGYGFLASPVKLQGVCSVAMFNMNPRVSDSPLDAPRDFKTYCHQVKLKFRSVATAALEMGAEVLVCPDVGCGVFGNDPQVLGTMLGQVLREPKLAKLEVLLTGQVAFAEAVKLAATGAQVDLAPAPAAYFAQVYGKQSPAKARGGYRAPQEPMIVATVVKPVDATRGASGAPAGATHAAVGGGSGVTAGAPAQVAPAGPSGRASPGVAVPTAAPVAPTPGAASPVAAAAAAPAAAAAAPAAAAAAPAASPTVTVAPAASTAPTAGAT